MIKIIFDLDNCLHPLSPSFADVKIEVAADIIIEYFGVTLEKPVVVDIIKRAITEKRDWMVSLSDEYIDRDQFHDLFHKRLDHRHLSPYPSLVNTFTTLGKEPHVLLTHSSMDWAVRLVRHLGLSPWFPTDRIVSWEQYREPKDRSTKGFEIALNKLGVEPHNAYYGDDTLPNLAVAKRMGMKTMWPSHGKALPSGITYVDHMAGNVDILLQQYIACQPRVMPSFKVSVLSMG